MGEWGSGGVSKGGRERVGGREMEVGREGGGVS